MGFGKAEFLRDNPELAQAYDLYQLCKSQELVVYRKPERDGKEKLIVVPFTTHLAQLPRDGGVEGQNYVTMRLFAAFKRADNDAAQWMMKK